MERHRAEHRRSIVVTLALIIPAVAAVLVFLAGTFWVTKLPAQYTSRATVIFSPKVSANGAIPGSEAVILAANNDLGFIKAESTVREVAAVAGVDSQELAAGTAAEVLTGTATMDIDVTTSSPETAAKAATAYGDRLITERANDPLVAVRQVGAAAVPTAPSGPARTILTVIVAALAALVGLILLSLWVWFSRIRSRGGLRAIMGGWLSPKGTSRPADDD